MYVFSHRPCDMRHKPDVYTQSAGALQKVHRFQDWTAVCVHNSASQAPEFCRLDLIICRRIVWVFGSRSFMLHPSALHSQALAHKDVFLRVIVFHAIWEFAQSADCAAQSENPQNAQAICRLRKDVFLPTIGNQDDLLREER